MRTFINVFLVAGLTALLAQAIGWIAVPVAAVIVSLVAKELKLRPWQIGLGAALAWGFLLTAIARSAAFPGLLNSLGAVFNVPGIALLCVALLLPFALGWSTGVVMSTFVRRSNK